MENFDQLIHLPDLQFAQFCEQHFSVNKGIYNTIDDWFYKKGIVNLLERRRKIFQFMLFSCSNKEKVKFGPGGLAKALEDFWSRENIILKAN